jgi:hypothetical protein
MISLNSTMQLSNATFAFLHSYNGCCYFIANSALLFQLIANRRYFRRIS